MLKAEDPYASMEKGQLISMIHFLVKREDERTKENQELKDMVKELRDTHKQDVKTQTNLLKSIDNLTDKGDGDYDLSYFGRNLLKYETFPFPIYDLDTKEQFYMKGIVEKLKREHEETEPLRAFE